MIIGCDWGNSHVKLCTPNRVVAFPSMLIPYRKMKVKNANRVHDFIFQYKDRKGLAGTLAEDEQTALDRNRKGDTKFHEDALIRLLIALHQYGEPVVNVVVGQPVNRHNDDKGKIIHMLQGTHTITVNGITKQLTIKQAVVGVEGGSALLSNFQSGLVHLIDIGSGTINFSTLKDGRFINSQSITLAKGIDNADMTEKELAEAIQNTIIDLDWKGNIHLVGGGAYHMKVHLPYPVWQPVFQNKSYGTEFSNAIGFYRIGEKLWNT